MTSYQFTGRMGHWQRTGCPICREALIAESSDPEAMRRAFEAQPPPAQDED